MELAEAMSAPLPRSTICLLAMSPWPFLRRKSFLTKSFCLQTFLQVVALLLRGTAGLLHWEKVLGEKGRESTRAGLEIALLLLSLLRLMPHLGRCRVRSPTLMF